MKLRNEKTNACIEVQHANTFIKRLCGLMFRKAMPKGCGIYLSPCSSIHTCFMRFSIDVLYFNKKNILIYKETLKPWRMGTIVKGVYAVAEFKEGEIEHVELGERFFLEM